MLDSIILSSTSRKSVTTGAPKPTGHWGVALIKEFNLCIIKKKVAEKGQKTLD
jgi:hypothetical protein